MNLKILKTLVVLWAWGSWAWVAYSSQWLWLIPSVIPYFLYESFGYHLDGSNKKPKGLE